MAKGTHTTITTMQKEDTAGSGGWNSFAILKKDTPTDRGVGTAKTVRIRFILDDRNVEGDSDGGHVFSGGLGTLWAAAYQNTLVTVDGEGAQLDPDNIVSIRAAGPYGNVTLPINRRIHQNSFDGTEDDGWIYLWVKNTDITTNDHLIWRIFIETEGRYVEAVPL